MKCNIQSLLLVLLLVFTLIIISCASPAAMPTAPITIPTPPPETKPVEPTPKPSEITTSYPLSIRDDLGREILINKMPERIVSLAPSNTEMLFALGLDDRIVGVTDYCDYPEAAKSKPRVASYQTPNMEKLVSIQPDIIFAEAYHEKTVLPALEKLNFNVVGFSAISKDAILHDIDLMGLINNKQQEALDLVNELTNEINLISSKTRDLSPAERPRVLHVVWFEPIWTMGARTYINDLINLAGGVNIFANEFEASRMVSLESIIVANPQIIIVSGMGTAGDTIFNDVKSETRLKVTDAFRDNRVYKFSDADLIERPGPRISMGLQELAKLIHPEIFGPVN